MKVVILCGGRGTRAYPYTRLTPKALMPVGGVPVLEQLMRIYASHGYDEFVLAAGYLKEEIGRYLRSRPWNAELVDTGDETDTGGRIRRCLDRVGEVFHATYVDGLGDIDLTGLEEFHRRHGAGATLTSAPLRSQYGILEADADGVVSRFVEKPILREYWINAGFFVFDRDAFAATPGENLERDILPELASRGRLRVHRHTGFWRSMDTVKDQRELDELWAPYSEALSGRFNDGAGIPGWLSRRYQLATRLAP
jgi:glucose-1-phosphate cytidylyltransferase